MGLTWFFSDYINKGLNYESPEKKVKQEESKEGEEVDPEEPWDLEIPSTIPLQLNGNDCGLYTCLNLEIISRRQARIADIDYQTD